MNTHDEFVTTAEAAFIARLTDHQLNRVVDEHLMPDVLFGKQEGARVFTRLCAALSDFYFDTEVLVTAAARRLVLDEVVQRLEHLPNKKAAFALRLLPEQMNWKVNRGAVVIDLTPYLGRALARVAEVDQANALVVRDSDVMTGAPVFAGTRVPIEIVLASVAAKLSKKMMRASYPFLTREHLKAAQVYTEVHPLPGRMRRLPDVHTIWKLRSTRVVRAGSA
jgi:uncharacterized protein (DUF433 family)